MKKPIALLCVMVFLASLFVGCGGSSSGTATPASSTKASASSSAAPGSSSPAATTAVNNKAENGKASPYGVVYDKDGVPTGPHKYVLPLPMADKNVYTYWFGLSMAASETYITEPADLLVWKTARERTGVNIEFQTIASNARTTSFSVMMASDNLCDIIKNAKTYYKGSMATGIDEKYFVNIYDYIEYCPNFHYYSCSQGSELKGACFLNKNTLAYMTGLNTKVVDMSGIVVRGDWMTNYGTSADDIDTYDQLHDLLVYFKNEKKCKYPLIVMKTGDVNFTLLSLGYDTIGSCGLITGGSVTPIVYNGKVDFPYASTQLRDYLTMLNKWYSEGLMSPDFPNYATWNDVKKYLLDGTSAVVGSSPTYAREVNESTSNTIGAHYVGISKPVKRKGDMVHLGGSTVNATNTVSISASCKNIPLIVSWLDYFYSDEGFKLANYGIEGTTYTVLPDGSIWWTDLMVKNPQGMSLSVCYEYYTTFLQAGLADSQKGTYCEAGKGNTVFYDSWQATPTDRAYVWPVGVQLTQEQSDTFTKLWADVQTYIIENQVLFISGQNPMSKWDSYVASVKSFGNGAYDKCVAIYQEAYNNYMKMFG